MKRHENNLISPSLLGTAVATASFLSCGVAPATAQTVRPEVVSSGIYVSILTPTTVAADGTKELEISAFYQAATSTGGVTSFELYVDGQRQAVQNLDTPDSKGIVSFRLQPGTLTAGEHHFVVTVSAFDAEVASAKTDLAIAQPVTAQSQPSSDIVAGAAPTVAITSPIPEATVQGIVDIKVDAHDSSGKPPYVSLFIDNSFKTLRNYPPFDFAWDTTRVLNGTHTIEVWGYNDDQAVGHAEPLTVIVNNPGGRTTVRHDLLDTVPVSLLAKDSSAASKSVMRHEAATVHKAAPRVLAEDEQSLTVNTVRLASAEGSKGEESTLSEETMLMAPFLEKFHQPAVAATVAVPTKSKPALAAAPPATIAVSDNQLNAGNATIDSLSNNAELTAPSISEMVPAPFKKVVAPTVEPGKQMPGLASSQSSNTITLVRSTEEIGSTSSDISLEAPAVIATPPSPADISNDRIEQPKTEVKTVPRRAQLAATTVDPTSLAGPAKLASSEIGASDLFTPNSSLQAPQVLKLRVATGVATRALAAGTQTVNVGESKLASSAIDSSELFSNNSSLQTPQIALKKINALVAVQSTVPKQLILGQSSAGFPTQRVLAKRSAYQIVMNDRVLSLQQPLQDHSSFLYAPFRQIFESQGGVVSWNAVDKQVHALNGSRDILLTIGSKTAMVNDQLMTLTTSPYINLGHTMIPLSFVPIALNATVSFDPETGHLLINSND